MINYIPVEIQQHILIHLPVDKNLVKPPWISEDMLFVMRHMQAAVDRDEVDFMASCLSLKVFWTFPSIWISSRECVESSIKLAVLHRVITYSVPQRYDYNVKLREFMTVNVFIWAAAHGAIDATNEPFMGIAPSILNANLAFDPAIEFNAALLIAGSSGERNMVELLLQDPRVDPNATFMQSVDWEHQPKFIEQRNRVLLAAARLGRDHIVRLLLSLVEASKEGLVHGRTQLVCVSMRDGHLAVVKLLLTRTDADINAHEMVEEDMSSIEDSDDNDNDD
ncbi:hypothetical protein BJ741DRAFT_575590 [Chytriomyces cf. hyalinus JEL632]|nr:hypothetical protein BJ741DRAFT_575590 [Chytriomyces cf. hyalinus JEL632]